MKTLFTSDYCEGALPRIIQRLQETNMVQTVGYGEDEYCAQARELIRSACGRKDVDVHFLVGGTQTNATVISSILKPYQGVLCAETGHINVHETGAVEHGGHKILPLPSPDGKITAGQIREALEDHFIDAHHEHMVMPGMVYISFSTESGTIYSREELTAISEVCRSFEIPLFVDGARLGYGMAASELIYGQDALTLKDFAQLTDVFYIGGTKQGALFGEAVVITNDALKEDFRYCIKQGGGMLAKGRLLGIQFAALFEDGLYMDAARGAVQKAARIREAFEAKGIGFLVDSPTNQVFPILTEEQMAFFEKDFGFEVWKKLPDGRIGVRFCTSWATPDVNVRLLVSAIKKL
ncbi:MAG: aminotransferase class I/II-fold pyridoxal phosphate-dependent enzyme [Bacteroidales bacterium]|nr:aminotransferase class I/II-fold pyridoxal phosphate-dependent enzyme [Bacteroidales bacterium]